MTKTRVAVVGTGITGLGASWLLAQDPNIELVIYERNDYIGGHTNTIEVKSCKDSNGNTVTRPIPVDTGFIVYNDMNYPNLIQLFGLLGVKTEPSDMSFALSVDSGNLEWAGDSLYTLFAQKKNLFDVNFWRMVFDILRFNSSATELLSFSEEHKADLNLTVGEYLEKYNYSDSFLVNYFLPMTAAIWSCPQSTMLAFPIVSMVQFLHNHCLLQLGGRPVWRTVVGGSREYVKKILETFPKDRVTIKVSTGINSVTRQTVNNTTTVELLDTTGQKESYDHVVFASHADQTIEMLGTSATREEKSILGNFKYQANRAFLHQDVDLMPKNRSVWSSWNYLSYTKKAKPGSGRDLDADVALTYWMNRLQPTTLQKDPLLLVTLNPIKDPKPETVLKEQIYHHPIFDKRAVESQEDVNKIQGTLNTWYGGAWLGYGFHEDGLRAGLQAASKLLKKINSPVTCPFPVSDKPVRKYEPSQSVSFFQPLMILGFVIALLLALLLKFLY